MPKLEDLEQAVAETPVSQIPALIGILAQLQAKAQLKMLSEQKSTSDGDGGLLTMRQVAARLKRWQAFETKREAEDFLDQERPRTRQRMTCAVEPSITIQEYAKRWLGLIEAVVKPGTYRRYEQLLNRHIVPCLGPIPVRHLHKGVVKDFLAEKLSQPVKIQNPSLAEADQKEKQLARNSVRNLHAILRTMLRAAVDDGLLLTNPADKLGRQLRLVTSKTTRQEAVKRSQESRDIPSFHQP